MKKIYGVGINDADYTVTGYSEVDGKLKQTWRCPYYKTWTNMLKRCYCPKYQVTMPTYKAATVDPEWFSFTAFKGWMEQQSWEGLELDKDILSLGGKVYSKQTCCFIPRRINSILLINPETRGSYPLGASPTASGKYQAVCKDVSARAKGLGTFCTEMQAHSAWQVFKAKVIKEVASAYLKEIYGREDVYNNLIHVADKLISESGQGQQTVSMWT